MLLIFKNLRKRLIGERRITNYLIYGIGEIVLVVVGIMIALQIDNWNEDRIAKQLEKTILQNIQEDIMTDQIDLKLNFEYIQRVYKNESLLMEFLLNNNSQSLDSINYTEVLGSDLLVEFHQSSFNNLQNNGIGLITNNDLYKKITRYYDFYSQALSIIEINHDYTNTYDEKFSFFKKHFKVLNDKIPFNLDHDSEELWEQEFIRYNFIPKNLDQLRADEEFKIVLAESIFIHSIKLSFYDQIIKDINALNGSLEDELKLME